MKIDRFLSPILIGASWISGCSVTGGDASFGASERDAFVEGTSVDAGDGGPGADTEPLDVSAADMSAEASVVVEGGYDTSLDSTGERTCADAPPEAADILTGACAPATDNECDGAHDPATMQGYTIPNGPYGNGFDDDCDGLVDEGCACDPSHPVGTTKECFLMPSSWTDDASRRPVGWCAENAKGTVRCEHFGGPPEQPIREWSGECRGARPPTTTDVCMPGDFNCDGVEMNPPDQDCTCGVDPVTCPTEPVRMNPFPNPYDLTAKDPLNPLLDPGTPFLIDGYDWIDDTLEERATDWQWDLTGGDCDNILPHPTFALYGGANTHYFPKIGVRFDTLGENGNQHGYRTHPDSNQHQIFPAFSLSGDYVLRGRFQLEGKEYECSVKVQVRAPGIRAELCWDNVGKDGFNDVDLHFARLQGNETCDTHGWFLSCGPTEGCANCKADDCYYDEASGCAFKGIARSPGWGYPNSHEVACHGWGSLRFEDGPCTNPRLDRDNISCDRPQSDPNGNPPEDGRFCGPENINLDNPSPGDRFLVGVQCYACVGPSHAETHPHVNVYCNGERVFSSGYDPDQTPPHRPALVEPGQDIAGDLWSVAMVNWTGDASAPCTVEPVPSQDPDPARDGSVGYCVDNGPQNGGWSYEAWLFAPGGDVPASAADACWH